MNDEIDILAILKEMREIIGQQAQEIALLKAMAAKSNEQDPTQSAIKLTK
jgi:hypothetical protein